MSWITDLFSNEQPQPKIGLEQKAVLQKTKDYKDSTLKKIHRAKIKSPNDLLNFGYLIGSYLGKDTDLDNVKVADTGSREERLLILVDTLHKNLIGLLEKEQSNLEKGTETYNNFYKQNSANVKNGLRFISSLVNDGLPQGDSIDPLQMAIIRPIIRYEYKVNGTNLFGKENQKKLLDDYYITNPDLQKLSKREMHRIYIPTYASYVGIGIGVILLATTIFKHKKR